MKTAILILLFALAPLAWSADKEAVEPFTLSVVPSRSSTTVRSISIADDKPEEFYVVLTNSSADPQPVFEYWNSWGYQNVSFELKMPDGQKVVVSKRAQTFTVNFPSTFLIPPGEHRVLCHPTGPWLGDPPEFIRRFRDENHVESNLRGHSYSRIDGTQSLDGPR